MLFDNRGSIGDVFSALVHTFNNKKLEYCVCGNYYDLPDYTSNDIDIWVEDHGVAFPTLVEVCKEYGYVLYLSNATANGTNNFFYRVLGEAIAFLHVDLLVDCSWSSVVPLVASESIKDNREMYKNFSVASASVEAAMHLLYPLIQYGMVKEKYQEDFYRLRSDQKFIDLVIAALGQRCGGMVLNLLNERKWDVLKAQVGKLRRAVVLNALPRLRPASLLVLFHFAKSVLLRLACPNGLMIAVIGPDGAGKTTTLSAVSEMMKDICPVGKFRLHYWRPFLLPELNRIVPLRKAPPVSQNSLDFFYYRKKQVNRSWSGRLKYLVKFCYYSLDFMLGWIKVLPVKARGGIICFDRYYYDHMVYPERFGFSVPRELMDFVEKFIYKPDLVFLLAPPANILLARKQELPPEELERQLNGYTELVRRHGFYRVDTSTSPEETVRAILGKCLSFMSHRYDREG